MEKFGLIFRRQLQPCSSVLEKFFRNDHLYLRLIDDCHDGF